MTLKTIKLSETMIPKFHKIFNSKKKHIIITSGRAGTKSSFGAIKADYQTISEQSSVIVLRKRHNKLRKTVYKEMIRGYQRLGIASSLINAKVSPMELKFKQNGSTIYFSGSDSVDDTKGIIDENNPIKLVILDELTEFFDIGEGKEELANIEATFVRGNKEGFQMLYFYNPPKNPNAPINKWLQEMKQRSDCEHIHVTYQDVPVEWLGQDLIETAEIMRVTDEKMYNWVWLGQSTGIDELIYSMYSEKNKTIPSEKYVRIHIGIDYGQQNATTFQAFAHDFVNKKFSGLDEYFHSGRDTGRQKSPSEYAKDFCEFVQGLKEKYKCNVFIAHIDPSAQGLKEEITRECVRQKLNVQLASAINDVALGISRCQILMTYGVLTISEHQKNLIDEIHQYEYDKKMLEKGKEVPVKQFDHCVDSLRYSVMGAWHDIKIYLPFKIDLIEKGS